MSHFAFILPDLNGGGAQKMMINIANEFVIEGNTVDFVLFNSSGVYVDLVHKDIKIIEFNKNRSIYALYPLIQYLKEKNPKVVFTALTYINLIVIVSKALTFGDQSKLVISERNNLTRSFSNKNLFIQLFYYFLVRFLYPYADHIVGISNGVCDDLKNYIAKKYHYKIQTIHNPVVTNKFKELLNEAVQSYFSESAALKLVTSGRLEEQKDYPTMFHALSLYKNKYGDFQLVIMGKGTLKDGLKELAEKLDILDNISFLGFVENPLAVMKQADIFIISSAWEGFCNVIIEALYCAKPVVSTDCEFGPSEILNSRDYGQLVSVGDYEAFCDAIHTVRQTNFNGKALKKRALEFSSSRKSLEFKELVQ